MKHYETFEEFWADYRGGYDNGLTAARAAWNAGTKSMIRKLRGEWGEMEICPTETIEDCVRHVRSTGKIILGMVYRLGEWSDWGNKLLGPNHSSIYDDRSLRKALIRKLGL